MIDQQYLFHLIGRIISNRYTPGDLNQFIHICISMAAAYLRTQLYFQRTYLNVVRQDHDDLKDLSVDAVASLFARDEDGYFYYLKRYFEPLMAELKTENALCLSYLRKLVISKTKQEIVAYFRQEDPSGWNIYRNLQLVPKRNSKVGVFEDLQKKYYYIQPNSPAVQIPSELKPWLPEVSSPVLENWFRKALKKTRKTPAIIEEALANLNQDGNYRLYVSREKLFSSLKSVLGLHFVVLDERILTNVRAEYSENNLPSDRGDIFKILATRLEIIVDQTYTQKGKISTREALVYKTILRAYFGDFLEGCPKKIPEYLDYRPAEESLRIQWDRHKNRLEYLIRLGKRQLQELWVKKNFRIG